MWIPLRLPLLTLLALLLPGCAPAAEPAGTDRHVEVSDGRDQLRVVEEDGSSVLNYSLSEWREWASPNLEEALGGPVTIGELEKPPADFEGFGTAALSASGEKVLFTTTTYAMLTTVSVVHLLDLGRGELRVVSEPAFGWVPEFHWSPDSAFAAYPLDTARAAGDGLRVDDLRQLVPLAELGTQELIDAARQAGVEVNTDRFSWMPEVRELEWTSGDRLRFTTNGFDGGELRWSFDAVSGVVAPE